MDQRVAKYRIGIWMKKRLWGPFTLIVNAVPQNTWMLYFITKDHDNKSLPLLAYQNVANAIFLKFTSAAINNCGKSYGIRYLSFLLLIIFAKKTHLRYLIGFWISFCNLCYNKHKTSAAPRVFLGILVHLLRPEL